MGFWESALTTYDALRAAGNAIPFHIQMLHDFHQSFLEGDRWLLYLKGLLVTFQVTIVALILHNIIPKDKDSLAD